MQLLTVKGAVLILIELVEQGACGGLRLVEVDRSILVGVKGLERRRRERGRSARNDHSRRKEIANKDASVKVFALIIFIEVLLQMITKSASTTFAARLVARQFAVISEPPYSDAAKNANNSKEQSIFNESAFRRWPATSTT